jgi:hypothetical protein
MKKVFGILETIFVSLGAVLMIASCFLPITATSTGSGASSTSAVAFGSSLSTFLLNGSVFYVVVVLGAALIFFPHKIVHQIGYGLYLSGASMALVVGALVLKSAGASTTSDVGVGPILALVGAILAFVSLICEILGAKLEKEDDSSSKEDEQIKNVLAWKDLLDKGIITKEEFEAKRMEILHLTQKK